VSGIRSRGRRGSTAVPNWRWEDLRLDTYDVRVAGWLASHADSYLASDVTRNQVARMLGMSGERASKSLDRLEGLEIIERTIAPNAMGGGDRWVITFDFDVWETDPAGRVATSNAGRVATSSIGEQSLLETNTRDVAFEELWKLYPNKNAKKPARAQYDKLSGTDRVLAAALLPAWLKNRDPKFAPYLQRWLRDRRWEDEPARPGSSGESRVAPPKPRGY
jgi:hypothetical protein